MNRFKPISMIAAVALAAAPAFGAGKADGAASKPTVAVSVIPQKYFVDRISGGRVDAMVLVGPGQSPHSYEPTPRQMASLSAASAWLSIGVDFEVGLKPKIAALYPKLPIVDTTVGVAYRTLEAHGHEDEDGDRHEGEEHAEDEEHADAPGSRDLHVWLGRRPAKAMAAEIRDALIKIDPAGEAEFRKNHDAFVKDVDAAFDSLKGDLAPLKGKPVFVYHPSFGYYFDEFGIVQEAVETGGKEPTQKALAELIRRAKEDGAKVIFVQAQFPAAAAKTVADSIGGAVATIDPLAPDWLENIGRIGAALKKAAK
jgi:zinc transport system substrate-binding protein